ncbi:MAG: MinD/ParA family protein [Chloroflexi bacterium]|nr:MinD/ParA family protein [Chloroflexota bacterium]
MAKIVSIHSFHGGTGTSTTAANLTALIAQTGKRVGVVDTDIQSPGIHVLFNLDDKCIDKSLNDYLWGKCPIEDAAYDCSATLSIDGGEVAEQGAGMYLIPSSIKSGDMARVLREGYDVNLLNAGFRELTRRLKLDYLLIDTHPGLNEETLLSITLSDILIIIMRPDQQDFQGTAVTVDVARRLDVPRLMLVVNKVLPRYDLKAVGRQVAQTYDAEVAGVLPLSEDVVGLASGGIFALKYPDHPLTQRYRQIAAKVMG